MLTDLLPRPDEAAADRRTQILDAAETCFARSGFHRTTMQDVAAEAGMSPGNLYRYFRSKDAIVAGLVERDRAEVAAEFSALTRLDGDLLAAFRELGRKHFEDEPAEKAMLCLGIWAEATRNPAIADLHQEFDADIQRHLQAVLEAAKARGALPPSLDSRAVAAIIGKLADGLFVRRAIARDFDAKREVAEVFAVIEAMLADAVTFPAR